MPMPGVCPVLLFFRGLVKLGQSKEVDYILQGAMIKWYVLQGVDCRSLVSESPKCLLNPLPPDSEPGGEGWCGAISIVTPRPARLSRSSWSPYLLENWALHRLWVSGYCQVSDGVWLEIQTGVLSDKRAKTRIWHTTKLWCVLEIWI